MIPNLSGGGDTAKRIAYLIGRGHRGEHENPHLIGAQGWEALAEKGPGELLDKGDVSAITGWLDEPMHLFGKCPRRRTERVAVEHPDGTVGWELTGELKPAHYRGWSLTLPEEADGRAVGAGRRIVHGADGVPRAWERRAM